MIFPMLRPPILEAVGNHLEYGGKRIDLKGLCVGDVLLARKVDQKGDYAVIAKEWKANCVPIGVAPVSWRTEPESALKALKSDVSAALKAKMFVIIDWHAIGWPDGYTQLSDGKKDLYDSDFALATSFWKQCAKEYRNEGRVAFQLWCEPVFSAEDWRTPPGSTWPVLKPFFQRLTTTIRDEGAQNLVLASGNRWAYDLRGIRKDPLPDANTGYEWHVYGGHEGNDPAQWAAALDDLDKTKPVVVTEWGFQEETEDHFKGNVQNFGQPFLDFMNARGFSWTAWCYHPTWTPNLIESDWRTPTSFGKFVKSALAGSKPADVQRLKDPEKA